MKRFDEFFFSLRAEKKRFVKIYSHIELYPQLSSRIQITAIFTLYFRAPEDETWKHVDFILRQDQLEGVKVFIKRH